MKGCLFRMAVPLLTATVALHAADIPKGTKIKVQLESQVPPYPSDATGRFDASLLEPVVVQRKIVAPVGSKIEGRIVAVQPSQDSYAGFVSMRLMSIDTDDATFVIRTKVLTRQGSGKTPSGEPRPRIDPDQIPIGIGKKPTIPDPGSAGGSISMQKGGSDVLLPPGTWLIFITDADSHTVPKPQK
jgi:hypothetical protein